MLSHADAENNENEIFQNLLQERKNVEEQLRRIITLSEEKIKPFKNGIKKFNIAVQNCLTSDRFFKNLKTHGLVTDTMSDDFHLVNNKVAETVGQMQKVADHIMALSNASGELEKALKNGADDSKLNEKIEAMNTANNLFKQECRILKTKLPFPSYDSFKNTLAAEMAELAEIQPAEGITDDFSEFYALKSETLALFFRRMEICSEIREIHKSSLSVVQDGAQFITASCAMLLLQVMQKGGATIAEFKAALSPNEASKLQEIARKAGANLDEGKIDPSSSAGSSQHTSDEPSAPFGHHDTSAEPSAPHIPHKTTVKPSTPLKHHETSAEPSAPHISHKTPAKPSALPKHHETSHEPSAPLNAHETSAEPSAPLDPHASFASASTPSRTGSEHSDSENRHSPSNSLNGSSDGGSPAKPKKGAPSTAGTFSNSANAAKVARLAAEQNALVAETRPKRKRSCVIL